METITSILKKDLEAKELKKALTDFIQKSFDSALSPNFLGDKLF